MADIDITITDSNLETNDEFTIPLGTIVSLNASNTILANKYNIYFGVGNEVLIYVNGQHTETQYVDSIKDLKATLFTPSTLTGKIYSVTGTFNQTGTYVINKYINSRPTVYPYTNKGKITFNVISSSNIKIKTSDGWKDGKAYVKTDTGWKESSGVYVKTESGWKQNS